MNKPHYNVKLYLWFFKTFYEIILPNKCILFDQSIINVQPIFNTLINTLYYQIYGWIGQMNWIQSKEQHI